jgi:hypothetical protein
LLGCAVIGVVLLLFDVVRGRSAGIIGGGVTLGLLVLLWLAMPWTMRKRIERD